MAEMLRRTPDELETPAYAVVAADRPGGGEVRPTHDTISSACALTATTALLNAAGD